MKKTFEVTDSNSLVDFKVVYDIDALCSSVEDNKCDTDEEYENYGMSIPIGADEDEYNTREEHNQHVDDFIKAIKDQDSEEALLNAVSAFPKKKNGTFKKNQCLSVARLNNSYYSYEEFGWPCEELRYKAIDDTTLELQVKRVVIGC